MVDGYELAKLNDKRTARIADLLQYFRTLRKYIYLRQGAAQRWIRWRHQVLGGQQLHTDGTEQLAACDAQLRFELAVIPDDSIYSDSRSSYYQIGRWTLEDSRLRRVQRWLRARR
ncbi:unnamed protein product [Diplocarpon coronariae]